MSATRESVLDDAVRMQFFLLQFQHNEGWIEIASQDYNNPNFQQEFFKWPHQSEEMMRHIDRVKPHCNVWYGVNLLSNPKRSKDNVTECYTLWSDLDTCDPREVEPKPSIIVQSSKGRWQGVWLLDQPISPAMAEEYSRRIAYKYHPQGADLSGWDLNQLLRVPNTTNFKYNNEQQVQISNAVEARLPVNIFSGFPEVPGSRINVTIAMPDLSELPDAEEIVTDYISRLGDTWHKKWREMPGEGSDWSKVMWAVNCSVFEAGMTVEEAFVVMLAAQCNKFNRDGRGASYTWNDVVKCHQTFIINSVKASAWEFPALVGTSEIPTEETFIERYVEWASAQTDAAVEYHEASAFIILSAMLSSTLRVHTSIGTMVPNLWVMILADTTLTRKTTAMDLAMELIEDVDEDAVLATDGSVEGLLQSIAGRPKTPSIFLRDEFTGLMSQMVKKDYMAGMLETFTKLYDGKNLKRVLKKEVIEVKNPIFILYAGGIKNKMQEIIDHEHVSSGFIPRFLVISAESKLSNIRPLGPRTDKSHDERKGLIEELSGYKELYTADSMITSDNGTNVLTAPDVPAEMTPEAWDQYNKIEAQLLEAGVKSEMQEYMTPVFDRMAKNMLKMAALIAAVRQRPVDGVIEISLGDINRAASFIQKWAPHTIELVNKLGMSYSERLTETVMKAVDKDPGILRSQIMRSYRISAGEMDQILKTLEQRALLRTVKEGKGMHLWPE